ncbi:MAG: peptidylprolyl isomerase [Vicinamibacterales bacterium]
MKLVACLLFVLPLGEAVSFAQRPVPSHPPASAEATDVEVARVNGVPVPNSRLAAALSALIPEESFHRNVSPEKMTTLKQQALKAVVDDELVYQAGVQQGIVASPADLETAWTRTVARYGGPRKIDEALRSARVTRASVRKEIARQLVIEKSYDRAVTARCRVTQEQARQFFSEHTDRFVEPEQVHVHAVTVGVDPSSTADQWREAKARAASARAALAAGAPFGEVARAYSTDPSRENGGDMGFIHRGSLASPFEQIVSTLAVGAPSEIVETIYGYHIVLVSDVRPPEHKAFAQVVDSLVTDLTNGRCTERKEAWLSELRSAAIIQATGAAQ